MAVKPNIDRIRAAALARRSTLFVWMTGNYRPFSAALEKAGGKYYRWSDIAGALAGEGLLDGKGRPPSPETVRKTWTAVCKYVAERNPQKRKPQVKAKDIAPGVVRDAALPPPPPPSRPGRLIHNLPPEPYAAEPKLFDRSKLKPVSMRNQTTIKPEGTK